MVVVVTDYPNPPAELAALWDAVTGRLLHRRVAFFAVLAGVCATGGTLLAARSSTPTLVVAAIAAMLPIVWTIVGLRRLIRDPWDGRMARRAQTAVARWRWPATLVAIGLASRIGAPVLTVFCWVMTVAGVAAVVERLVPRWYFSRHLEVLARATLRAQADGRVRDERFVAAAERYLTLAATAPASPPAPGRT